MPLERKHDEAGRVRLSMREWNAIRVMHASIDSFLKDSPVLKKRLQEETEGGWRICRLAETYVSKLDAILMKTVPTKQLVQMKAEMANTHLYVRVEAAAGNLPAGVVYVEQNAFIRMVNRAVQMQCFTCDKTAKEARRCDLCKDIQAIFPYSIELGTENDECIFAGLCELPVAK